MYIYMYTFYIPNHTGIEVLISMHIHIHGWVDGVLSGLDSENCCWR